MRISRGDNNMREAIRLFLFLHKHKINIQSNGQIDRGDKNVRITHEDGSVTIIVQYSKSEIASLDGGLMMREYMRKQRESEKSG